MRVTNLIYLSFYFSFDQNMRVDETLMQTFACQLSCNSCSRLTRTWELMKLSCKLSLVNSHATLVLVRPEHESWWNPHLNSRLSTLMQLLFSFDQDTRVDENSHRKLSLVNSHATLVLVWPGHESWWNSHANSRLSTLMQLLFSFDQDMRVDENSHVNSLIVNSHATLVLVWPGHESWLMKVSSWTLRLSTLMQLLFSFDQDMRVDETLMQTFACQLSCNIWSRLTRSMLGLSRINVG